VAFTGKFGRSRSTTAASDDSLRPTSPTDRKHGQLMRGASAHPPVVSTVSSQNLSPAHLLLASDTGAGRVSRKKSWRFPCAPVVPLEGFCNRDGWLAELENYV